MSTLDPCLDSDTVYMIFRDFLDALAGEVESVYLLRGMHNASFSKELQQLYGIQIVSPRARGTHGFSRVSYILAGIKAVRQFKIDVVTNTYGGISYGFDAWVIALMTGRRSVVRVAGNEIKTRSIIGRHRGLRGRLMYAIDYTRQWMMVNFSHAILAQSPWEVERLKGIALVRSGHIYCCPRGVDLKVFRPEPPGSKGQTDVPFTVLYVGRESLEKGYDLVLEAARALRHREDICFLIAGEFQESHDPNVQYCGYVHPNKMAALYQQVDMLLLPSRTEGFPQAMAEVMAMGKPCVVSRNLFEGYFEDGEHALLCELDAEDIAKKILYLYENPAHADRIGQRARAFVVEHLDKQMLGVRYKKILLGLPLDASQ